MHTENTEKELSVFSVCIFSVAVMCTTWRNQHRLPFHLCPPLRSQIDFRSAFTIG